jgi:hypothetical protein
MKKKHKLIKITFLFMTTRPVYFNNPFFQVNEEGSQQASVTSRRRAASSSFSEESGSDEIEQKTTGLMTRLRQRPQRGNSEAIGKDRVFETENQKRQATDPCFGVLKRTKEQEAPLSEDDSSGASTSSAPSPRPKRIISISAALRESGLLEEGLFQSFQAREQKQLTQGPVSRPPEPSSFDPEFFRKFGVKLRTEYSTKVLIDPDCQALLRRIWKRHEEELAPDESHPEAARFIQCIQSSEAGADGEFAEKVEIRWLGGKLGYGLFAKKDLKKGEIIGRYTGILTLTEKTQDKSYAFEWPGTPYEGICTIDGREIGNYTRFMNHTTVERSNASPVEFFYNGVPEILFVTDKPVRAGSQLLYSYGKGYWEALGITPDPI